MNPYSSKFYLSILPQNGSIRSKRWQTPLFCQQFQFDSLFPMLLHMHPLKNMPVHCDKNGCKWTKKMLLIATDNAFPSFWQSSNSITVEVFNFWGFQLVKPFWDVFVQVELLISQTMWHLLKQVIIRCAISSKYGCCGSTSDFNVLK